MKYAWVENNIIKDIAPGDPFLYYHSDIAQYYSSEVPDTAINGAEFINGEWVNPVVVVPTPIEPDPNIIPVNPGVISTPLTKLDFRKRFTLTELIAMDNYETGNFTPEQKAVLKTLNKNFDLAEFILLTDEMTLEGIQYLETCGILGTGRVAQILGIA